MSADKKEARTNLAGTVREKAETQGVFNFDKYITSIGFFEGLQMWLTDAPVLELRRAAR